MSPINSESSAFFPCRDVVERCRPVELLRGDTSIPLRDRVSHSNSGIFLTDHLQFYNRIDSSTADLTPPPQESMLNLSWRSPIFVAALWSTSSALPRVVVIVGRWMLPAEAVVRGAAVPHSSIVVKTGRAACGKYRTDMKFAAFAKCASRRSGHSESEKTWTLLPRATFSEKSVRNAQERRSSAQKCQEVHLASLQFLFNPRKIPGSVSVRTLKLLLRNERSC